MKSPSIVVMEEKVPLWLAVNFISPDALPPYVFIDGFPGGGEGKPLECTSSYSVVKIKFSFAHTILVENVFQNMLV